ncbi:MAG: type II toxin-antitoxin system HicB family antitoxin [Cyclobacteriaceae bacterium]
MQYNLIIEKAEEGGFVGFVPEIPGAFTQGENEEEVRENIVEVIELLKEVRIEKAIRELGDKKYTLETFEA